MWRDSIVEEVDGVRRALLAECGDDLNGLLDRFAEDNRARNYTKNGSRPHALAFNYSYEVPKLSQKWDNIVAACFRCNHKKGGRTPEEAGMRLVRQPTEPPWLPAFHATFRLKSPPESWRDYLYWNIELDI